MNESSLEGLYKSTVQAFPFTNRRQHSTDKIKIVEMDWTPFLGLNTLLIRGTAKNEGKLYKPLILFKDVNYTDGPGVTITASDGRRFFMERLTPDAHDVLVKCSCADFKWRFNFTDHLGKSLYGRKRAKYEGKGLWEANPLQMEGMCKHLIKLAKALEDAGVIK